MAFDGKSLDDYVDVAERIAEFRERHPDGTLQPLNPAEPFTVRDLTGTGKDGKQFTATFIVYTAAAYRSADDARPGIGTAWEVFPGRTPYTLGSELMNAETSAWGRAIVAALAADAKRGVASKQEVRNRAADRAEANGHGEPDAEDRPGTASQSQVGAVQRAYHKLGFERAERDEMLAASEKVIGRELGGPQGERTHKNLSHNEARKLLKVLGGFTERGDLLAALVEAATP